MVILLIPEFSSSGGTRTYFKSLLEHYYAQNYKVYILLKKKQFDQEINLLIKNYGFTTIKCVEFTFVYKAFGNKLGLIFDNVLRVLYLLFIKMRARPSLVVYSHGDIYKDILQLIVNRKFIYIVHSYPTKKLNKRFKFILNKLLGPQRIILTVSKYSRTCLRNYWAIDKKKKYIYYIYNFVQTPTRSINKTEPYTILTFGHVVDYKNPYFFIDVAKAVTAKRQVKFIWAGEGALLEACRSKISKDDSELIKFVGYKADVEALYENATLYFQPSLVENHSISVLEAMSHGLPCIVSDRGGLPESVIDGYNGYVVDIQNIEETIEKITLLIDNDQHRAMFSKNALKTVNKKFNKAVWVRKMNYLHCRMGIGSK